MPILFEPDQRYEIVLDSDVDKTPPPTFWAKALSLRGQLRLARLIDDWADEAADMTVEQLFNEAVEVLQETVVDWSHMIDPATQTEIPYTENAIKDWLTYLEIRELIRKCMYNSHVPPPEKKSSESPPSLDKENSAKPVLEDVAT